MAAIILILWTVIIVSITSFLRKFNAWWYEPNRKSIVAPLPPGDLGWPILGCMPSLWRAFKSSDPERFTDSYKQKYGRTGVYKTHLFGSPTIMSTAPETNRSIYTNADLFLSGWPASFKSIVGESCIAIANGNDHKRLKRLTIPALTGTETLSRLTSKVADKDVREFENWVNDGKVIEIYSALNKMMFDRILNVLISSEEGLDNQEMANLYIQFEGALRSMPIWIPGTAYYSGYQARLLLDKKIMPVISRRREGERKDDLLQSWMDKRDEDGPSLTDKELLDMIISYMLAGHKSSGLTFSWFMVYMNDHPKVLAKVRMEAQGLRDKKPLGEPLKYEDIRKLKYLDHVLDEILRLVNIAPYNFRKAAQDTTLNGFAVPKGWKVQTWPRAVHLDPEIYADPTAFNPDRWINRQVKPGEFNPFSDGYRLCPGKSYAKTILATLSFYLALDFTWEPINANYEITYLPFPKPKGGYPVKFSRRTSN